MIIIRYLIKKTLKNQLVILFILLLIFFCQKLIKILSAVINGVIPTNLILSLLALGVPDMAQLILPLSLFLGLLITFGKLYSEREIMVMYACGFSKIKLLKAAMVLALLTGIVAAINVMWIGPISSRYQNKILAEAKANPRIKGLAQRQLHRVIDGNSVLFIESLNKNHFNNIFLAQLRHHQGNTSISVIVADSGQFLQRKDRSQIITLNKGTLFESAVMLYDFRITEFQSYQAMISHQAISLDSSDMEHMDIHTLINMDTNRAKAQLHWRITLIFSVFIMALMVVPMSAVNLHQEHILSILSAMLLYLLFFLLQTSIKLNGSEGKIDPMIWTWTVNGLFLLLAISLNLWDTVLIRRLRILFVCKEPFNVGI